MDTQLNMFQEVFRREPSDSDILRKARPKLVGLAGVAGSGKSTAAQTLVNYGFIRIKFADPLKNALRQILRTSGMLGEEIERRIEGDLKEEHCSTLMCTPRHAMQTLGDEWGRQKVDQNFWVNIGSARIRKAQAHGYDVVVDDVRYENEANLLRSLGGSVFKVTRPVSMLSYADHPSEAFDWEGDGLIVNGLERADLIQQMRERFL